MKLLLGSTLILALAACANTQRPAPPAKKPAPREAAKPAPAPSTPAPAAPVAPVPATPAPPPATSKPEATATSPSAKYSCFKISIQQARSLYVQGHTYLDRDGDGRPCEWPDKAKELDDATPAKPGGKCTTIKAYTKPDGTKVPAKTQCS
ncbi:hypothetical protein GCM10027296_19360 [Chitinimonas naiadis]